MLYFTMYRRQLTAHLIDGFVRFHNPVLHLILSAILVDAWGMFISLGATAPPTPVGQGLFNHEVSISLRHTTVGRTPLDE